MLQEMIARGVNCPQTSSCGRLFDALSALCGLCFVCTYEGQAAVLLEEAQDMAETSSYKVPWLASEGLPDGELDVRVLFRSAVEDRLAGVPVGRIARRFHLGLARSLAEQTASAALTMHVRHVALCGGVMLNRTIAGEVSRLLSEQGLCPLLPSVYPPGDGAIALGQASWGRSLRV
jgi:hydrogenase maturation protein HypF